SSDHMDVPVEKSSSQLPIWAIVCACFKRNSLCFKFLSANTLSRSFSITSKAKESSRTASSSNSIFSECKKSISDAYKLKVPIMLPDFLTGNIIQESYPLAGENNLKRINSVLLHI